MQIPQKSENHLTTKNHQTRWHPYHLKILRTGKMPIPQKSENHRKQSQT
ncbi:MAG: hypothetical protein F6K40_22655 [Okeania sp. SIO3I5]|nr:hypothetical protein [Okeania sp. SIO3I5]NEQ38920.1 hypothetical protein [Okeania sp. SIO3I5]